MNLHQLALAANLVGRSATVEEVAKELGSRARDVRSALKLAGVSVPAKPFGFRPVTISLSPTQIENLRAVADRQGLAGFDRHSGVLEALGRRIAADPKLAADLLDATKSAVVVDGETIERLKADAKRRGLSAHELAAKILDAVAKDSIVAAVIDG